MVFVVSELSVAMSARKLTKGASGKSDEVDEYWNEGSSFKKFNFDEDDEEDSIEITNWDGTKSNSSNRTSQPQKSKAPTKMAMSARAFRGKAVSNQSVSFNRGNGINNAVVSPPEPSKVSSKNNVSSVALAKLETERNILIKQLSQAKKEYAIAPSREQSLKRFMLGDPVILELYKSLEDKVTLLDKAILRHDGNAILAITLFLRNTLKRELFSKELMNRPIAVNHYCSYLKSTSDIEELHEILTVLGRTEEAAMLKYRHCLKCAKSAEVRANSLGDCVKYYFDSDPRLINETKEINDQISLLKRQIIIDDNDKKTQESSKPSVFKTHPIREPMTHKPVIATLYYCCYYHWGETEGLLSSPYSLKSEYKIGDKQFMYITVAALCRMRKWRDLETYLTIPKSIFRQARLHAVIGFEKVVDVLSKNMAPPDTLEKYCKEIESTDSRLEIATKLHLHKIVIDTMVQQKDRQRLQGYLNSVPDSNQHMRQHLLHEMKRTDIKWKN